MTLGSGKLLFCSNYTSLQYCKVIPFTAEYLLFSKTRKAFLNCSLSLYPPNLSKFLNGTSAEKSRLYLIGDAH